MKKRMKSAVAALIFLFLAHPEATSAEIAMSLVGKAEVAIAQERYDDAITLFTDALATEPKNERAFYGRGVAKLKKHIIYSPIADFSKAVEIYPNYPEAYNDRGVAEWEKGELDSSIADFDKAISLNSKLAEAYANRGGLKCDRHDFTGAGADIEKSIALNPRLAESFTNLGILEIKSLGDFERAIFCFDRAIDIKPRHAKAYLGRGIARMAMHEYRRATAEFDHAVAIDPDFAEVYYARGLAKKAAQDYEAVCIQPVAVVKYAPVPLIKPGNPGPRTQPLGSNLSVHPSIKSQPVGGIPPGLARAKMHRVILLTRPNCAPVPSG